jgi:hypothetical protein
MKKNVKAYKQATRKLQEVTDIENAFGPEEGQGALFAMTINHDIEDAVTLFNCSDQDLLFMLTQVLFHKPEMAEIYQDAIQIFKDENNPTGLTAQDIINLKPTTEA